MKLHPIYVTSGTGSGPTPLAAFDSALYSAGIGDYNLIHLSSVIPPHAKPVVKKYKIRNTLEEYGRRLYVVYAVKTEVERGKSAWSGLGWVMTRDKASHGLFVEHTGGEEDEVVTQIKLTLGSMTSYRDEKYSRITHKTVGIHCNDEPVCAIVAAVYKSVPWNFNEHKHG